jgi:hypothetical protein
VRFGAATVHLAASVAVGQLIVEVPNGVVVDVSAHTGIGNVTSDLTNPGRTTGAHAQLDLDAEAGVGHVLLERVSAG